VSKFAVSVAAAAMILGTALPSADAHINLTWPLPRFGFTNVDQKVGPCGSGNASGDVIELEPGSELTVSWTETVNHPGQFRIALDMTGSDAFADPVSENDMDVAGNVIAYLPDDGGNNFAHTFTLPDTECEGCVIQVIQVMTDKLGNGYGGYPSNDDLYYWCADIALKQGAGMGTTSSSGAGAGGTGPTGGTGAGGAGEGAGNSGMDGGDDGGGCSIAAGGRSGSRAWLMLGLAAAWLGRRRRD
jgi:MYXO-CTERM domain-containing protein